MTAVECLTKNCGWDFALDNFPWSNNQGFCRRPTLIQEFSVRLGLWLPLIKRTELGSQNMFGSISACVYSDGPKPDVAPLQLCPVMFERAFRPTLYKFFPGSICSFFTPKTHAYSNKRTHVLLCLITATWFVE